MKFEIWSIGKTSTQYIKDGELEYLHRLKNYMPVELRYFETGKLKGNQPNHIKKQEAELILDQLKSEDTLILLDENGIQYTSLELAHTIQKWINRGPKRIIFLIGGAWGFDESLYQKAHALLSLSRLTFTHQMVRIFFLEQLYRSMTILRNEPYHNS